MAGISRSLRNTLFVFGVGGGAIVSAGAWYIGLDTFQAEDGAPAITFELPPTVRHHVIFDRRGVEYRKYFEEGLVYQGACGWVNDSGLDPLEEPKLGCLERRYK